MSVEAFGRALTAPIGGNPKVILLGLANHAHPDGTNAFPSIERLAGYAHCDRRTAQRNVRKLEDDGWIEREGVGPMGQTRWRILFSKWEGGGKVPRAASVDEGGGTDDAKGAAPVPPEPSLEPSTTVKRGERARAKADEVPDDFPESLRPHARIVFPLLRDVAVQHNARPVTARAVALTIMGNPGRRFVSEAHAFAAWAQSPPRPIKDVVGSYRTWLKRAEVFAGVEQIGNGAVTAENVTPIRRRGNGRSTAADYQSLKGTMG
jgi:hypothetical protein